MSLLKNFENRNRCFEEEIVIKISSAQRSVYKKTRKNKKYSIEQLFIRIGAHPVLHTQRSVVFGCYSNLFWNQNLFRRLADLNTRTFRVKVRSLLN